jgi:PLAT/LH2 domain-containing protein
MAQIESIQVNINTGDESGAGTDGSIYVGLAGREFHLDTSADDFERGSSHKYVLGVGSDVVNPAVNDPRKQFMQVEDVDAFPIYVRFEPNNDGDNWNLARADVSFNDNLFPRWETTTFVSSTEGIWLGQRSGTVVHLRKHLDAPPS